MEEKNFCAQGRPSQKERLYSAAHRAETDRPPCICPGGMMNMISKESMELSGCFWPGAHSDPEKMAGLAVALNRAGGFENYGVPFCMTVEAEAMGAQVNMGNSLAEPHVTESPIRGPGELEKLKPMDLSAGRPAAVLAAIRLLKKEQESSGVPIIGNLCGPVSLAGTVTDMGVLLRAFRKEPEKAERLMDFVAENLIAFGREQIRAGADAVCISEPSGTGEILGPRFFEAYSVKYVNRVLDALEVPVKIVHICGDLRSVYRQLAGLHCHVFSFDSIVNISEIKPFLEGKAVMGNVNTHAIGTMSADKVGTLAENALSKGVDLLAPACGLPVSTPLANIQALVAAAGRVDSGQA